MKKILLLTLLITTGLSVQSADYQYDILIQGGTIIDGTGKVGYQADLAIRDDSIVKIGKLSRTDARQVIDATGRIVTPGFIDLHSHSDRDLLKRPAAENNIRQGVTTLLGGNCGGSPVAMAKFLSELDAQPLALNMGMLIGHNAVRRKVMQRDNRHASADEMAQMKLLVDEAMNAGAFGMSSGLIYIPGAYAPPEELVELAQVVQAHKGFYASHMRSEGPKVLDAVEETIQVGLKTGIPVHISHHKTSGPSAWGLSKTTLAMIDEQRRQGQDVTLDQYPYTASNTNLGVLLPAWSLEGGRKAFEQRMQDPDVYSQVKAGVKQILQRQRSGTELWRIQISRFKADTSLEGKTFEEVLTARGKKLSVDNAAELAIELNLRGGGRGIYHTMQDEDVERIMRHPMTSVASDGRGTEWQVGMPHPRNYGTYPRILAHYVRDKQVLELPDAIRKMTSLPASRMGLTSRGTLAEGMVADVLVFDPLRVQDHSTFKNPHQYSSGIDEVIVNGQIVMAAGELTGSRPGKALRRGQD